jgi:hypothetical protein
MQKRRQLGCAAWIPRHLTKSGADLYVLHNDTNCELLAMTEPAPALPPPLAFTYRKGEPARFRKLTGLRVARVLPWNSFWIVVVATIFVIGLAVLAAQKTGLIDAFDVPPVLFTAYLAFGCGAGLFMTLFRRRQRQLYRATEAAAEPGDLTWEATFDDAGMTWKNELRESRVAWRTVTSIESWRGCVMIWLGPTQSACIPARIFPDNAALHAFMTAVQARIKSAAQTSTPDRSTSGSYGESEIR